MNILAVRKIGNATYRVLGGLDDNHIPYYAVSTYRNGNYIRTDNYKNPSDIYADFGIRLGGRIYG